MDLLLEIEICTIKCKCTVMLPFTSQNFLSCHISMPLVHTSHARELPLVCKTAVANYQRYNCLPFKNVMYILAEIPSHVLQRRSRNLKMCSTKVFFAKRIIYALNDVVKVLSVLKAHFRRLANR